MVTCRRNNDYKVIIDLTGSRGNREMKKNSGHSELATKFASGIATRLRMLRAALGMNQTELSGLLKRANNNAVSRLERASAGSIFFDVLERLVRLAEGNDHAAEWLLTGFNISPAASIADLEAALTQATTWHYINSLPPDCQDEMTESSMAKYAPPMVRGYSTVPAEDVPTDHDWWKSYVPVIGRIAAGEGAETMAPVFSNGARTSDHSPPFRPAWHPPILRAGHVLE